MGINVKKENDTLIITWQLSKTEILLKDVEEVGFDETYGGEEKMQFESEPLTVLRIGYLSKQLQILISCLPQMARLL